MQTTVSPLKPPPTSPSKAARDLSNLCAPVLGLALRLRARDVELSKKVRPRVEELLKEIDGRAAQLRCTPSQIKEVKFALVAYFDETVLSLDDSPLRTEWKDNPLQIRYDTKNWAGDEFYDQLDELLKDVKANADVIEVYYHCLLLGFKGKYNFGLDEDEELLRATIERVAIGLRIADRLVPRDLSGRWHADDQPPTPRDETLPRWAKISVAAVLTLAFFTYLILYSMLPDVKVAR